jgi:GWxTD domain-containing protein
MGGQHIFTFFKEEIMKKSLGILVLVTLAISLCLTAVAQDIDEQKLGGKELDEALDTWFNNYVRYIITDGEKNQWKALTTQQDKLAFIEFFWQLRDQTPETPENEYRKEYMRRWAYVQRNFTAGKPGWKTDRGRIYLMLGEPSQREQNPFGRNSSERPSETWYYNNVQNQNLDAQISIAFVDFLGYGDYEIVSNLDQTARFDSAFGISFNALDAYALRRAGEVREETGPDDIISTMWDEAKIRHPEQLSMKLFDLQRELREVAKVPKLMIRPIKEKVQTHIVSGNFSFAMNAGVYKGAAGRAFIPVTLAIPLGKVSYSYDNSTRLYKINAFARIRSEKDFKSHEEELQIKVPVNPEVNNKPESIGNYLYQFSFMLPPGEYDLQVTLRDQIAQTVGYLKKKVVVDNFDNQGLQISDIQVADLIAPVPENASINDRMARPFQFSNRKVIPNVKAEIPVAQDNFYLYWHVYNFGLDPETGNGKLKLRYFLYRDGKLFSKTPESTIQKKFSAKASIETKFVTGAFGPGDYKVVAAIEDTVSGEKLRGEVYFKILPPAMKME